MHTHTHALPRFHDEKYRVEISSWVRARVRARVRVRARAGAGARARARASSVCVTPSLCSAYIFVPLSDDLADLDVSLPEYFS